MGKWEKIFRGLRTKILFDFPAGESNESREREMGERKGNDRPVVDCHVRISGAVDVELEKNLQPSTFLCKFKIYFHRD